MKYFMKKPIPDDLLTWNWSRLEPAFDELENEKLDAKNIEAWLLRWTQVSELADELYNRLYVSTTVNTADAGAQQRLETFMEETFPKWRTADQKLKEKLIKSGLKADGMDIPLRNMRAETAIFREENLPLLAREEKLNTEHDRVMGAQTVTWEGGEKTVRQMEKVLRETDRETRRAGWERMAERQLADREEINSQWEAYMALRREIAANADMPDYRAYRWQQLMRFDYTPADCKKFQKAIEETAVPAATRLARRRRKALGVDDLRYYDLFVDLSGQPPLNPFNDVREMTDRASAMFHHVYPKFGEYFDIMDQEGYLDLDNRKNKANGGYTADFSHTKRPFIFANAVGIHDDVQTLLHEGGHAFHAFEAYHLPYFQQRSESAVPMEFAEVASMAMEYLTAPYIEKAYGGFYSEADAIRARVDHIESDLLFWPYMAIVDAFQHWVYENPDEGSDARACDEKWGELEKRFRPYIDWSGYEDVMVTGWQRKDHIHQSPFYYVEYGLALMGAVQIWRRAMEDQPSAVSSYRKALALGGTATLPELFREAGAKLAFDAGTLGKGVKLMESEIYRMESAY